MANNIYENISRLLKKGKYNDNPKSYAYALSIYKLIWLFIIGSVAGYLIETGWYYMLRGNLINRQGVVIGPFSPIYGIAAVGITLLLYRIRDINALHIIVISGLSGGAFEYLCSILQEKVLGTRSWDYSQMPFNINGRTSLKFMLIWGMLGMIFIRHTYPFISKYIEKIPHKLGKVLAIGIIVFLLFDCMLSIGACMRQKDRRDGVLAINGIERFLDDYYTDETLSNTYTEIRILDNNGNVVKR